MAADLHLHTVASDGTDTVQDRVEQAREYGLDTIAITDHDTINSDLEKRSERINEVEVITGAEINCHVDGTGIEILGYFLDPQSQELREFFDSMKMDRRERMREMVSRVSEGEEIDITLEEVENYANGTIGRPHLGKALVDRGIAEDMDEAFNQYIGEGAPTDYYVKTRKPGAGEVIEKIRENGGVTSLAHPGRNLRREDADEILEKLISQGLDSIEVPYTYQHKRQDGYKVYFGVKKAHELARKHELPITGGSDCHGSESNKYNIGKIHLSSEDLERLRDVADSRQNQ